MLHPFHKSLPIDARTLLHTPRNVTTKVIAPGHYYYFGLRECVLNLLSQRDINISVKNNVKEIRLYSNIDGLPIAENPP